MSSFSPRTTQPTANDPYWTKTTYGGYNRCIIGSPTAWSGSVLANCTGYAWGRWLEMLNLTDCTLSTGNAENWYNYNDGYQRGNVAKLGAICCWANGPYSGLGHVGIVEEVLGDYSFRMSNSAWDAYIFRYEYVADCRNWDRYDFQGFIYPPVDFDIDEWLFYWATKRKKIKVVM